MVFFDFLIFFPGRGFRLGLAWKLFLGVRIGRERAREGSEGYLHVQIRSIGAGQFGRETLWGGLGMAVAPSPVC
jgi:hypothetical protein